MAKITPIKSQMRPLKMSPEAKREFGAMVRRRMRYAKEDRPTATVAVMFKIIELVKGKGLAKAVAHNVLADELFPRKK